MTGFDERLHCVASLLVFDVAIRMVQCSGSICRTYSASLLARIMTPSAARAAEMETTDIPRM